MLIFAHLMVGWARENYVALFITFDSRSEKCLLASLSLLWWRILNYILLESNGLLFRSCRGNCVHQRSLLILAYGGLHRLRMLASLRILNHQPAVMRIRMRMTFVCLRRQDGLLWGF